MAGHSKWANIKHRKAKQDAAKGKVFIKSFVKSFLLPNKANQINQAILVYVQRLKSLLGLI